MKNKKFLEQVYNKMSTLSEQNVNFSKDYIEVLKGENVVFKIDAKGDVFCSDDKQFSDIVKKLRCKIENDVRNTKEFLEVMDNSPELTAVDLNVPYKKLLEYNDVVLAGTEHSDGSFEFVTWDYKNNSLDHGHYYEDYGRAKEDFVKRAGLLPEDQIFSADERVEIARCVEETMIENKTLCDSKMEMLSDLYERIERGIPDFYERFSRLTDEDYIQDQEPEQTQEQTQEQTM